MDYNSIKNQLLSDLTPNEIHRIAERHLKNRTLDNDNAVHNNWRKCRYCGKFISYKQMEEQKDVIFHFVPDTHFTTEESYYVHKSCNK